MRNIVRIVGIGFIFLAATCAWLVLGTVMSGRADSQWSRLHGNVGELWGRAQDQQAPKLTFAWTTEREDISYETVDAQRKQVRKIVRETHTKDEPLSSTRVDVDLHLDQRLKGLVWYALYDVSFNGAWTYVHREDIPGDVTIEFDFADASGLYDDFKFVVNGHDYGSTLRPDEGHVSMPIHLTPGEKLSFAVSFKSRGQDSWSYVPAKNVANLEDFRLGMTTDFDNIDFPKDSLSPSAKARVKDGWRLDWNFERVVTGRGMGMTMPTKLQPGALASELSYSAPISLGFFFLLMFVLTTLRGIDLHPMNYWMLAAAFFAFHLLFGYSVDHLTIVPAFALSSAVSILLVTTYLRLVVGSRFAFVEAALGQLVYLVGFSLAHFWEGYTGLTVTVLSILTLFLVMQLTGRMRWSEVFASAKPPTRAGATS